MTKREKHKVKVTDEKNEKTRDVITISNWVNTSTLSGKERDRERGGPSDHLTLNGFAEVVRGMH